MHRPIWSNTFETTSQSRCATSGEFVIFFILMKTWGVCSITCLKKKSVFGEGKSVFGEMLLAIFDKLF